MRKFKWFWSWEDDKEEKWLSEMSLLGQHLTSMEQPRMYTFEQGDPADYAYHLDFLDENRDMDKQVRRYQNAGWFHLGPLGEWQYFRKKAASSDTRPPFYDGLSKINKHKRTFISRLIVVGALLVVIWTNARFMTLEISIALALLLLILFGFVLYRLWQRIIELQKSELSSL